ncbi:MAG: ATP-dependent Lon protease [Candidatus Latescibacterota bacterium]|jgi:ATP-dependent Lon protease
MDATETIPLFPLPLVVFPGQALPLHIFEPRYRQMLVDVRQAQERGRDLLIGICLGQDNAAHANVGCAVRLDKVLNEYPDGRADIMTLGQQRFRMGQVVRERAYLMVEVEYIEDEEGEGDPALLSRVQQGYTRLLQLAQEESGTRFEGTTPQNSFQIAQSAALRLETKQQVLEMTSENGRLQELAHHFEELIPHLEARRVSKRKVQSNGHAKKL